MDKSQLIEVKAQPPRFSFLKKRVIFPLSLSLITLIFLGLVFGKINFAVVTTGELQWQNTTRRLQMPAQSKIQEISVKIGDLVQKGELLLIFESSGTYQQLKFLQQDIQSLTAENQFYQSLIEGNIDAVQAEKMIEKFSLSKERIFLVRNSLETNSENQNLQSQLNKSKTELNFQLEQLKKVANTPNLNLEISEDYQSEIEQMQQKITRNNQQIKQAKQNLQSAQNQLKELKYLLDQGGISQAEYIDYQAKIKVYENNLNNLYLEQSSLINNLNLAKQKSSQKNQNIIAEDQKIINNISLEKEKINNYQNKILAQQENIKEINKNLQSIITENSDKLQQLHKKINSIKSNIKSEKIYSPISGQVLEINYNQEHQDAKEENFITIIPEQKIIAEIFIPYEYIDLIQENMQVEVTFNFLGNTNQLSGHIISLGSDILPPNNLYLFYRLPAQVSLSNSSLVINNQSLPLQVGMPVSVTIPTDQKRRIINIIFDRFIMKIRQSKIHI